MKITLPLRLAFLCGLAIGLVSCVSDVDFDQTDQIVFTPEVDLDLTFFELTTANFEDTVSGLPIPVVRDTTRLEFLDDDFIRDNLTQIELLLRYDNSFSQDFEHKTLFLDENNQVQFEIAFEVAAAIDGQTETTLYQQTIIDPELAAIRNAIKMLIEIRMLPDGQPIAGRLRHQSKAIYSLEVTDL
ncbi:MAG: hypothetical protein ABNH00_02730 [Dokdonia sp.]|jgi:hypothetical protein|nr:hypothetical protein [Cytophagaceae bacterium]